MTHNSKQEYKLYIELFCDKIKLPYLVFALIIANCVWILILILFPSEREAVLTWQKEDINILWSVTVFLMLIMIRRLRDTSIEKFLVPDMPYPKRIKDNMQRYLYAIFSPYTFKDMVGSGVGSAIPWFFFVILGYVIIGIIGLLREISKELKNSSEKTSFASIVKIKELKGIPLNILYAYAAVMISFPAVVTFLMSEEGPWVYGNLFILIAGLSGFFIALIIPSYYVHIAVKSVKEDFKSQTIRSIKNLENKISNKSVTERDLKKYDAYAVLVNMIERVEKVKTWPFDFESVTKIVIMGIVGSIPALLQYFLK